MIKIWRHFLMYLRSKNTSGSVKCPFISLPIFRMRDKYCICFAYELMLNLFHDPCICYQQYWLKFRVSFFHRFRLRLGPTKSVCPYALEWPVTEDRSMSNVTLAYDPQRLYKYYYLLTKLYKAFQYLQNYFIKNNI